MLKIGASFRRLEIMAMTSPAHHGTPNMDDKVVTYRWFVVALRLVILVHVAAATFALLAFLTSAGWVWAGVMALAVLFVGGRVILMPAEHIEEHTDRLPGAGA
jgi:hypothetical protein